MCNSKRSVLPLCVALLFTAERGSAQSAPPVPPLFQSMYAELDSSINSFAATIDASWNGVRHPVNFTAELTSATSALGERLLSPDRYAGVLLELDSMKATGVKAINIQLAFPILYADFYSSAAEYQEYVNFYKQLAAEIRARGMKLIARCSLLVSQQGFSTVDVGTYYRSLTLEQYQTARIDTIVSVLQQVRPDYLVVLNEPDVEALQAGKPELSSIAESTDFLRNIVSAARATGVPVSIGAGVGSWAGRYQEFIQSFLTTGINFLDLHVYPVNRDFLPRLIQAANLAQAAGKDVAISEGWVQKVTDAEMGSLPIQTLFSRDAFSFWAPIDEKFLQTLVKFSHYKKLLFFSPFWSHYLHAYVDYDRVSSLSPAQVTSLVQSAAANAITNGKFSSTGVAYARAIAAAPDVTKPGTPTGLATYPLSNNAIHLTWAASTDNVGIAGYKVFRNGNLVGTTAELYWQDIGLAPTTTYAYTLAAYDIVGNTSPITAAVSGRTSSVADTTPPSVPAPVMGAAMSSVQIELNWGRSTDNVKVVAYKIFRNGLEIAQVNGTAYSDSGLNPDTAYWYSVAAVDNSGNVSARSAWVQVATVPRDTQAPSIPGDVSAIAGRDIVYLSWTPSSDNVAVVGYHVFRNNVKIATSSVFTYQDTTVKASTTYTYKLLAADANGNLSGFSAPVTVTTPDTLPPSVPDAPTGVSVSTTQIKISWPAAVDNIKVAGYRIFRNGAYVTSLGLTQYLDSGLAPSTSYAYTVVAVDSSGNESAASPPGTASTWPPDTQAPSAPTITAIAAMSTSQVNLGWSPSTDNTRVAGYYVFRDGVNVGSTTATGFSDAGLTPDTTYVYTVRAFDPSGRVSAPSPARTVTTLAPPDTTQPTAPGTPVAYPFSSTQLLLVWPVSTDNHRVAAYYIFRNGVNIGNTPFPAWFDQNLSPATTYLYAIAAVDAAGNASPLSPFVAATTLPPPDRTPPSVPANVRATALASTRVAVTWAASSDNVRMAGYKIFRNGTLIAVSLGSPFVDQLVFPNTTYSYTVSAFDAAGNNSAQSAAASVTTPR